MALAVRATLRRGGLGRCPCSRIYSGMGGGRGGEQDGERFRKRGYHEALTLWSGVVLVAW